jgi:hypothetical protein
MKRDDNTSLSHFRTVAVLKSDHFSTIERGFWQGDGGDTEAVLRRIDGVPWWTRLIATWFLKREIAALERIGDLDLGPRLLAHGSDFLVRAWIPGLPMQLARPTDDRAYFRAAKRQLHAMHRLGVAHNDLAKEQNWLRDAGGRPRLTDFQLASVRPRRGAMFRIAAREDLRHLLKHKRKYCASALTAAERRLLQRKSIPARIWMASGKRLYNLVTRQLLGYADREGAGGSAHEARQLANRIAEIDGISAAAVVPYPAPGGTRLYAFVETATLTANDVRQHLRRRGAAVGLVQVALRLPRDREGRVREDVLRLVAENQIDLIAHLSLDASERTNVTELVDNRLNRSDRRLREA